MTKLILSVLPDSLAVCRLPAGSSLPAWATGGKFFSITGTPDELSIVCEEARVPGDVTCETGWRVLKVEGPLDFALVGILAGLSTALARAEISIFAISTYDTDYLLVRESRLEDAANALTEAGCLVKRTLLPKF